MKSSSLLYRLGQRLLLLLAWVWAGLVALCRWSNACRKRCSGAFSKLLNQLYWGFTRLVIQVILLLGVLIPGMVLVQLFLQAPGLFIVIGIVGMITHFSTLKTGGWEYGTARWATLRDLIRGGYLQHREGMIVGRVDPRFTSGKQALSASFDTLFDWRLPAPKACRMANPWRTDRTGRVN